MRSLADSSLKASGEEMEGEQMNRRECWVTSSSGVRLAVTDTGNPRGIPMVFVHGFNQARQCWERQLSSDLARDFRCIAFDLRGHGESDKPDDAYNAEDWATDLQSVLDQLELDQPVLVGWSFAGIIIGDYLRHFGDRRLRGIALVGAVTQERTETEEALTSADLAMLVPGLLSDDLTEGLIALSEFVRLLSAESLQSSTFYQMLGYNVTVPVFVRRQGWAGRAISHFDVLPTISKPVLIVHGLKDKVAVPRVAYVNAHLIPRSMLRVYPESGHMPFWEEASRFNQDLREFVRSTES